MSDYQADWERKRSPCHKCAGYRENSLSMRYCWRYREVQAAGGITLDTPASPAVAQKGRDLEGQV